MGAIARMFTDAYDYSRLRENMGWEDIGGTRQYIARARIDALVAREIVMTDVQFLHSRLLFNVAAGSRHLSLDHLPLSQIRIMVRQPSIEETLMSFLLGRDSSRATLVHHVFPALDPSGEIAKEIEMRSSREVQAWTDVPRLLKEANADPAKVDQMEAAWAAAIEYSKRRNGLRLERWADYPFVDSLMKRTLAGIPAVKGFVQTEYGLEALERLTPDFVQRTKVVARIEEMSRKVGRDGAERNDLILIEDWYNECYNSVVSAQHRCGRVEIINDARCSPTDDASRLYDQLLEKEENSNDNMENIYKKIPQISLSKGFLAALASMDAVEFDEFLADNLNQSDLLKWHEAEDWHSFEKCVDRLIDAVDKRSDYQVDLSRMEKIVGRLRLLATRRFAEAATYELLKRAAGAASAYSAGKMAAALVLPPETAEAIGVASAVVGSQAAGWVLPEAKAEARKAVRRSIVKSQIIGLATSRSKPFR